MARRWPRSNHPHPPQASLTATPHEGTGWNDKRQRVSTVVQELPPKVALGLGQQLIDLFGPAGIRLAQLERERVPPEEAAKRRLRAALEELR